MIKEEKPFKVLTIYCDVVAGKYKKEFTKQGIKFKTRDILNVFYGTEFEIEKPTGKGAVTQKELIYKMCDPLHKL